MDSEGEDFESENGPADAEAIVRCPYCDEVNEIVLDPGSGSVQEYVQDCEVCCRPWQVRVFYDDSGTATVEVTAADGS